MELLTFPKNEPLIIDVSLKFKITIKKYPDKEKWNIYYKNYPVHESIDINSALEYSIKLATAFFVIETQAKADAQDTLMENM